MNAILKDKIIKHGVSGILLPAGLMALGLVLSMWDLDRESLWQDELYTARTVGYPVFGIIHNSVVQDLNPPLYYLILHVWSKVFGLSETALRFPSALFSVITVGLVYYLGTMLWTGRAGLYAGLLTAMSSYLLPYAQEARCYSLLAMLGVLSMIALWKMMYEDSRRWFWIYIITSALMLYCHFYAIFHLFAQVVFIGSLYVLDQPRFRGSSRRVLSAWLVTGVLFVPWAVVLLGQMQRVHGQSTYLKPPTWVDIPWVIKVFSADSTKFGIFLLAVCGFWYLSVFPVRDENGRRQRRFDGSEWNKAWFLGVWILCTVIPPFVMSRILSPIYSTRFMVGCTAAFYLLVGRGLGNIPFRMIRIGVVVVLLLVFGYENYSWFARHHREQWRESVRCLDGLAGPEELVVFQPLFYGSLAYSYYGTRNDIVPFEGRQAALCPTIDAAESLWLVVWAGQFDNETVQGKLQGDFQTVLQQDFGRDIKVYHLQRKP